MDNFALFNAPPGTVQHMGVYFYASPDPAEGTRQAVLALHARRRVQAAAGLQDVREPLPPAVHRSGPCLRVVRHAELQDLAAMKTLGLNIIGLSDFHGDMHPNDPGPLRFKDQKDYFEATRRASDTDFLVTPWEEPSAYFGGHYNICFRSGTCTGPRCVSRGSRSPKSIRCTARSITPATRPTSSR